MAAFILVACGGDGNKAGDPDPSAEADFVVDTFGDLSVCTDKREGAIAYVKDEEKDYICTDGDWAIDTNADTRKKSSSSKDEAKSSSSESVDEYDGEVEEFGDLSKCSEKMDGKVYYVEDEDVPYTCRYDEDEETGEWVSKKKKSVDDDDQESSSSVNETDYSSSSSESGDEYDGEVEEFGGLPNCTGKKDGKVYYVEDEDIAYTCKYDEDEDAGEWVRKKKTFDEDKSSSSSVKPDGSVVKGTMTDERDGQTYKTVKIGNQTWMAENLNYRYLGPTADEDSSSFCFENAHVECDTFGRLYLWSAAMDSAGIIKGNTANGCGYYSECTPGETVRGVCPKGWHLPSQSEWNELITAVGGSSVAGKMLKSEAWQLCSGIEGTDAFGFSALAASYRYDDGNYNDNSRCDDGARFWSSTDDHHCCGAYGMHLRFNDAGAFLYPDSRNNAHSVRCIQD